MTPSIRSMPPVRATWSETNRRWLVSLPGGHELPARDEYEVEQVVAKHAPGSAIQYVRVDRTA